MHTKQSHTTSHHTRKSIHHTQCIQRPRTHQHAGDITSPTEYTSQSKHHNHHSYKTQTQLPANMHKHQLKMDIQLHNTNTSSKPNHAENIAHTSVSPAVKPCLTRQSHTQVKRPSSKKQRKSKMDKTGKIRKTTCSHQSEHFRHTHKHQENVSKYNFLSQHQVDVNHTVPTSDNNGLYNHLGRISDVNRLHTKDPTVNLLDTTIFKTIAQVSPSPQGNSTSFSNLHNIKNKMARTPTRRSRSQHNTVKRLPALHHLQYRSCNNCLNGYLPPTNGFNHTYSDTSGF